MRPEYYQEINGWTITGSKGQLVAVRRRTGEIVLFLEDRQIWPDPRLTGQQVTLSGATAAGPSDLVCCDDSRSRNVVR